MLGDRVYGFEDAVAVGRIKSLAWFVQNEKRGVFDQRAREKHKPLLPF